MLFRNRNIWTYKVIILTIFVLMITSTSAQYVNQVNETPGYSEHTYNYDVFEDTLYSIGFINDSNNSLNGWNYLSFKKYDENYNVFLEKRYTDSTQLYGSFYGISKFQNSIYNCGTKFIVGGDSSKGFVTKYSREGDKIWEKNFYENYQYSKVVFLNSNDSAIFFLTSVNTLNSVGIQKTKLTAIDSSGNVYWDKEFSGSSEQPLSLSFGADKSIILSLTYHAGPDNERSVVYKLDSSGNTIWSKQIGGLINDHYAQAVKMPNGNVLAYGTSHAPSSVGSGTPSAWLVELDKNNGNILKDTVFSFSPVHTIFGAYSSVIFNNDHFLLVASTNYDQANPAYKPNLVSINYDFTINWRYQYDSKIGRDTEGFYEMINLQNGYYLLAGITTQNSTFNTNDEWFLVVDSLGCDDQWCTVGIEDAMSQSNNESNVTIYPNPSSGQVTFKFVQYEPNREILITDLLGKEIDRIKVHSQVEDYEFSNPMNGVYLVHWINEGIILQTQKIVVQK